MTVDIANSGDPYQWFSPFEARDRAEALIVSARSASHDIKSLANEAEQARSTAIRRSSGLLTADARANGERYCALSAAAARIDQIGAVA